MEKTTEDPALLARDLHRFYPAGEEETQALRGVSLTLQRGELVVVTGPSGSGKSTLMSCLAGLDEPDGGTVYVSGERMTRRPEGDRARVRARRLGILAQSRNLLSHLTVSGNVALARRLAGARRRSAPIDELLDGVALRHRRDALPETLSGGELVRAGLAVALANDPDVLLADEPTAELDSWTERAVVDLLRERAATGTAVLVASHSPAVADAADRVLALADGAWTSLIRPEERSHAG